MSSVHNRKSTLKHLSISVSQSVSGVLEYKFDKSQQLGQTDRKALITIVSESIWRLWLSIKRWLKFASRERIWQIVTSGPRVTHTLFLADLPLKEHMTSKRYTYLIGFYCFPYYLILDTPN